MDLQYIDRCICMMVYDLLHYTVCWNHKTLHTDQHIFDLYKLD